jgi:hypothetical protein
MPPRSVCLNVFTNSLGESNAAVREDGSLNAMGMIHGGMERRDSAQSGTSALHLHHHRILTCNRHRATLLSRLHRIDIGANLVLNLPHTSLQPRRHLQIPAPHGLHREPQLRNGLQAYVCLFVLLLLPCGFMQEPDFAVLFLGSRVGPAPLAAAPARWLACFSVDV